jgi:hypothetical protein
MNRRVIDARASRQLVFQRLDLGDQVMASDMTFLSAGHIS